MWDSECLELENILKIPIQSWSNKSYEPDNEKCIFIIDITETKFETSAICAKFLGFIFLT